MNLRRRLKSPQRWSAIPVAILICQTVLICQMVLICQTAYGFQSGTRKETADPYFKPTKTAIPQNTADDPVDADKNKSAHTISFPETGVNNGSIIREKTAPPQSPVNRGEPPRGLQTTEIQTPPWRRQPTAFALPKSDSNQKPEFHAIPAWPSGVDTPTPLSPVPPEVELATGTIQNQFVQENDNHDDFTPNSDNDFMAIANPPEAFPTKNGSDAIPLPTLMLPETFDADEPKYEAFELGRVLALVGGEPIFVGDVLLDVNQLIQKFIPNAPERVRQQQRPALIKRLLPKYIDSKLLYIATVQGLPEQADVEKILEQADSEFDEKALEKMMEQMDVKTTGEFDAHLRLMGSSLRNLRRSWSKEQLVRYFLSQQLNIDTDVSHKEMLDYYREHEADYTLKPRAKWEQVMVRFDKFEKRDDARKAIVELGNKIVYGAKLSAIAKQSSHGFRAQEGGQHNWTSRGALVLKKIDKALFELPVETLSEIIESRDGFHIVRVKDRDESTKKSFLDAQVEIKEKLENKKREDAFQKHLAKLKQEIPVEIVEVPEPVAKLGKK